MPHTFEEIASGWIALMMRYHPESGDLKTVDQIGADGENWAEQQLLDLLCNDPLGACQVIDLILNKSNNPWVLENLGAGPIEYLINEKSERVMVLLEKITIKNKNMSNALQHVWPSKDDIIASKYLLKLKILADRYG